MPRVESFSALKQVASLFQIGAAAGSSDGWLLDRFLSGQPDESEMAFAVLLERHGPMVLHVSRRIVGNRHDAEDVAQATFLILARQARSIRRMDSVASWLYGVAVRIATRVRRDAGRRQSIERRSLNVKPAIASSRESDEVEASREIHEELDRLPERFRLPILLCHLEGLTHEQAAQRMGCPVRTIQSRLARGRRRLRDRLARRGVTPAFAPLAVVLTQSSVSSFLSESWKQATARAAVRSVAGGSSSVLVSTTVSTLVNGVSRAMIVHKMIKWTAFLSLMGFAASGAAIAFWARPEPRVEKEIPALIEEDRYRVTMAGGASVEVVAVSTVPTGPDTWWRPDGSRLSAAPVDPIQAMNREQQGRIDRVILVRARGVTKDDLFRWNPTNSTSYWGSRPTKDGQDVAGLEYYEAAFAADQPACAIKARLASGSWKTEVSNDGKGGVGEFVNGHKFSFGKARPLSSRGQSMTVFAVAHNFFGQDRRLVAVGLDGKEHPADSYSLGSDGDKRWMVDLIDAEFRIPPEQIREYLVQFRPIEESEIDKIALNPRPVDGR